MYSRYAFRCAVYRYSSHVFLPLPSTINYIHCFCALTLTLLLLHFSGNCAMFCCTSIQWRTNSNTTQYAYGYDDVLWSFGEYVKRNRLNCIWIQVRFIRTFIHSNDSALENSLFLFYFMTATQHNGRYVYHRSSVLTMSQQPNSIRSLIILLCESDSIQWNCNFTFACRRKFSFGPESISGCFVLRFWCEFRSKWYEYDLRAHLLIDNHIFYCVFRSMPWRRPENKLMKICRKKRFRPERVCRCASKDRSAFYVQ